MKVLSVNFENDIVLGNLSLDFCITPSHPANNILLAGDNGIGKTRIMSSLYSFFARNKAPIISIKYEADDHNLYQLKTNSRSSELGSFDIYDAGGHSLIKTVTNNHYVNQDDKEVDNDLADPRRNGCAISKARSDFCVQKIDSTTSKAIDSQKFEGDSNDDFTFLKQLIIDLYSQDLEDYAKINTSGNTLIPSDVYLKNNGRISRFIKAINDFFTNLKMISVKTIGNEKVVVFQKNGKDISLDDLSTGEKQIVFRGTLLLQNLKRIENGIAFIDEPEISMHPRWQEKILSFYKNLFTIGKQQVTQLIFATHSEEVVRQALASQDTIVIVLRNENGITKSTSITRPMSLPFVSASEANYLAFDMPSYDLLVELYDYISNKNALPTIKATDDFILGSVEYQKTPLPHQYAYGKTIYNTLPTFVRNQIDHGDPTHAFSESDLKKSIELLRKLT